MPYKMSPQARKAVLESLMTTPERRELISKAAPMIEALAERPELRRMYVAGSTASTKPKPKDVDLLLLGPRNERYPSQESWDGLEAMLDGATSYKVDPILRHSMGHPEFEMTPDEQTRGLLEEGRARYGSGYNWKRILGVSGLTGVGALATPDQSEAMPFGPPTKQGLNEAIALSRTAGSHPDSWRIQGQKFRFPLFNNEEMTITDLMKHVGKENGKYTLVLTDGQGQRHQVPMTEDYFKLLMQSTGTRTKLDEFALRNNLEKELQASKGLTRRETDRMFTDDVTHGQLKAIEAESVGKLNEMSPDLISDYVFMKTAPDIRPIYIPRAYADQLKRMGIGHIIEGGPHGPK